MFSHLNFFLLAQLIWAVPAFSRLTPGHRSLSHRSSSAPRDFSTFVATTWFTAQHSSDFTLQDLSWSKYSAVMYAFAATTEDVNVIGLEDSDKTLLPQFVNNAHANNVRAILAIGGWSGSRYFSSAVATEANRTAFAQAVMKVVGTYGLDGVNFDWEHPGKQGVGCNIVSADDSANFLLFLQTLRSQDGAQNLVISAAVSFKPFIGSDGNPMTDVSGFAKVLDYIEIMVFDVWGPWSSSVGPNAPLNDACAGTALMEGSVVSAVASWTTAGFPANQIVLGVATYGHSYHVDQNDAFNESGDIIVYVPFDKSQQPAGDDWDSTADGVDVCGNPGVVGGVFQFWGLMQGGFLMDVGSVVDGIDYVLDWCSVTPYAYNPDTQVMVSFDDASSFAAKGKYIKDAGLAGFAMWEAGGDSDDILLDAIVKAAA